MRAHPALSGVVLVAAAGLLAGQSATEIASSTSHAAVTNHDCTPTATQLPDLGYGGEVMAFGGREVVGGVVNAAGRFEPAIWRQGTLYAIGRFKLAEAFDANAAHEIIGNADRQRVAWAKIPGQGFVHLKNTDGSSGAFSIIARRVNDSGQIAGSADGEQFAARWDSASSDPTLLPPAPGDSYSYGQGLNNAGWVAGDTDDANFIPRPAVWDPDNDISVYDAAFGPGSAGTIHVINDARQSAGESFEIDDSGNLLADVATVWSPDGQPTSLGYLPHDNQSFALGLSPNGYVTGGSLGVDYSTGEQTRPLHAFVWPGYGPLLTLPVPGLPYRKSESDAHPIDAHGRVGGFAGPVGGPDHPYVWTCVFGQAFRPGAVQASHEQTPTSGWGQSWESRLDGRRTLTGIRSSRPLSAGTLGGPAH